MEEGSGTETYLPPCATSNKGRVHFAHVASGDGECAWARREVGSGTFVDTWNVSLLRSERLMLGVDLVDLPERLEGGDEDGRLNKSSCSPIKLGGGEEGPEEIVAVSEWSEVSDGIDAAEERESIESRSVLIDDAESL